MDVSLFISTAIPTLMTFAPNRLLVTAGYVFVVVTLIHAFGHLRKPALFAVSSFTIGFASELLGVSTGFPFGPYEYITYALGPRIFGVVPLAIPLVWFALAYFSYHVGAAITSSWKWIPISAWMLVSLDIMIDPIASGGIWMWLRPGEVYGVPATNFLGWFIVSLTFYLIYHSAHDKHNESKTSLAIDFGKSIPILQFSWIKSLTIRNPAVETPQPRTMANGTSFQI